MEGEHFFGRVFLRAERFLKPDENDKERAKL